MRRMLAVTALAVTAAGCTGGPGIEYSAGPAAPSSGAPVSSPSGMPLTPAPGVLSACARHVRRWDAGPGGRAVRRAVADPLPGASFSLSGSPASVTRALTKMLTVAPPAHPVPACADPRHYWAALIRAQRVSIRDALKPGKALTAADVQQTLTDTDRVFTALNALVRELKAEHLWRL